MIFPSLFGEQLKMVYNEGVSTRSNKILIPIHFAIKDIISNYTNFSIISLPDSEYNFTSPLGNKKVDISIIDSEGILRGAILFKAIRSEYNKNANNYYEQMKGESSLFIDNKIPVYQIVFIPTTIRHKSNGVLTYEVPSENSYNQYNAFSSLTHTVDSYWSKLKLNVFYFDINYLDYSCVYSTKKVYGVENTLTEGLLNFIEGVNHG